MNEKLESAKNEIAKEHGYKSFEHFDDKSTFRYNHSTPDIIDEIAIRYHELMVREVQDGILNDYLNKLFCTREIKLDGIVCSNTIAKSINEFLNSKK